MSGGGGSSTVKQKADPWGPLQPYIQQALPQYAQAAGNVPEYYPGQTYAGFQPLQEYGFGQQLNYANALGPQVGNQFGALNDLLDQSGNPAVGAAQGNVSQYGNPYANPYFNRSKDVFNQAQSMVNDPYSDPTMQGYLEAAQRPLTQQYEQTVGNAIAGNAAGAGGLGGSRQGVAEGLAGRDFMNASGDLSSNLYASMFDRALGNQQQALGNLGNAWGQAGALDQGAVSQLGSAYNDAQRTQGLGLGLAPSVMSSGLLPSQLYGQVGSQYQGMDQNAITEAMSRYGYNSNAEYNRLTDYFNTLMGQGFGSSTGPNPNASSPLQGALGGGMLGYGLGGLFGGAAGGGAGAAGGAAAGAQTGSMAGPYGAAAGALLGALLM